MIQIRVIYCLCQLPEFKFMLEYSKFKAISEQPWVHSSL